MLDVLIRGARVVDGRGAPARTADLAVRNGRIVAVGSVAESAAKTLDAAGLCLMPSA